MKLNQFNILTKVFITFSSGHVPHFPSEVNVNTNMAGPMHQHYHMHPNAQYFGVHNIHYAAQHMAHMHWMQHMAHMMQGNMAGYNMPGLPVQQNM